MKKDQREGKELLVRQLGVFELRGLARELGITSPTTKKRDELIDLILMKFEKGDIVDDKGKRKGRPCKKLSTIDDILNTLANDYKDEQAKPLIFENILTFAQVLPNFDKKTTLTKEVSSKGIIRIYNSDKQFYDYALQAWVFIKDIKYSDLLKVGDKVEAVVQSTGNQDQYIAREILSINDIKAEEYGLTTFEKGDEIISPNTLPYAGGVVYEGRRNSILIENDIYENEDFTKLAKYCNEHDIKLVVLGTNTSFEDQIYFKSLDFENFTTKYGTSNEVNFNCIIDAIQYVQNLSDKGKNVLFYIMDIVEIMHLLDRCFVKEEDEEGHKKPSIVVIKKIISLGMAYANGGNISLIIGYNEKDKEDSFLSQDILKVCKKIN